MIPESITDFLHHLRHKFGVEVLRLGIAHVKNLVYEARLHKLINCDALAHDECLIRFANTQTAYETNGRVAFSNEAEGREGCQEEGMRRGVDEVAEGDKCR